MNATPVSLLILDDWRQIGVVGSSEPRKYDPVRLFNAVSVSRWLRQLMSDLEFIESVLLDRSIIDRIGDRNGSQIETKLLQLIEDETQLPAFMVQLFPSGIPSDAAFYERLNELGHWIGYTERANDAIASLWSHGLDSLENDDQAKVLDAFANGNRRYVYRFMESLRSLFAKRNFSKEVLQHWLVRVLQRGENDSQEGLWKGVRFLCERRPHDMFFVCGELVKAADSHGLQVASQILGLLRRLEAASDLKDQINDFEQRLTTDQDPRLRQCAHNSWAKTAHEFGISMQEVDALISPIENERPGDLDLLLKTLCRVVASAKVERSVAVRAFAWMEDKISPSLAIETKRMLAVWSQFLPDNDSLLDPSKWILPLQPVGSEEEIIWERAIHFLAKLAKSSPEKFDIALAQIADVNATVVLKALRQPHAIDRLQSDMKAEHHAELLATFLFSSHRPLRELGLFLFDKISFETLPTAVASKFEALRFKILFHEIQLSHVNPVPKARLTVLIAEQAAQFDDDFRRQLSAEISIQAQNYMGQGRAELRRLGEANPLVASCISAVEEWSTRQNRARESGIVSMMVPGVQRAYALYRRNMTQQIRTHTENHSLFRELTKTVHALYGEAMSRYADGVLHPPIPFTPHETSMEVPFHDTMDPENVAIRRSIALEAIHQIEQEIEASEENRDDD